MQTQTRQNATGTPLIPVSVTEYKGIDDLGNKWLGPLNQCPLMAAMWNMASQVKELPGMVQPKMTGGAYVA